MQRMGLKRTDFTVHSLLTQVNGISRVNGSSKASREESPIASQDKPMGSKFRLPPTVNELIAPPIDLDEEGEDEGDIGGVKYNVLSDSDSDPAADIPQSTFTWGTPTGSQQKLQPSTTIEKEKDQTSLPASTRRKGADAAENVAKRAQAEPYKPSSSQSDEIMFSSSQLKGKTRITYGGKSQTTSG